MFKYIKLKMSQDTTDFIQLVNSILWKKALERDNWEKLMADVSEGHLREFNLLKEQFRQESGRRRGRDFTRREKSWRR